jgi:hypothetical protein
MDGTVQLLSGAASGIFKVGTPLLIGASSNLRMAIAADWNGDGAPDLAVGQQPMTWLNAAILLNKNNALSLSSQIIGGIGPAALLAADFNGDKKLDLLVDQSFAPGLSVALGNGDGSFDPMIRTAPGVPARPMWPTATDINRDGALDIVTVFSTISISNPTPFYKLGIYTGRGDGSFRLPSFLATLDNPAHIESGDFNGDGLTDFLVVNQGDGSVSVFLNQTAN